MNRLNSDELVDSTIVTLHHITSHYITSIHDCALTLIKMKYKF